MRRKLPLKAPSKQNARIIFRKNNKKKKLTNSTGLWFIKGIVASENRRLKLRTFQFHVPNCFRIIKKKSVHNFEWFWFWQACPFLYDLSTSKTRFSVIHVSLPPSDFTFISYLTRYTLAWLISLMKRNLKRRPQFLT